MAEVGVALILARTDAGVIGANGGMPWHIPADLAHFKRMTIGKPCIIGRKTFDAIGRPLPRRLNIVLTRNLLWAPPDGVVVAHDLPSAKAIAYEEAHRTGVHEIIIVGGAEIFEQTIHEATKIYLTEIHAPFSGDVLFQFSKGDWNEVSRKEAVENGVGVSFVDLEPKKQN